jgi:hypothetical protein
MMSAGLALPAALLASLAAGVWYIYISTSPAHNLVVGNDLPIQCRAYETTYSPVFIFYLLFELLR